MLNVVLLCNNIGKYTHHNIINIGNYVTRLVYKILNFKRK